MVAEETVGSIIMAGIPGRPAWRDVTDWHASHGGNMPHMRAFHRWDAGVSHAIGTAGVADGDGGFNDRLDRPADCRKTAGPTDFWWDPMAVSA